MTVAETVLATVGDAAGRYLLGGVVAGTLDAPPVRAAVISTGLRAGLAVGAGATIATLTVLTLARLAGRLLAR
jgi:hypothetical protein